MIVAEDFSAVGIGSSGFGKMVDHVGVIPADDEHDRHAGEQTKHAAHWSGFHQIGITDDNYRAPAEACPD